MLVCKTCGSILVTFNGEWACSLCIASPAIAQKMYEKPHKTLKDKRVNK